MARAKWPVPRAQQKFYPDYPPSQYYTFHPMYGNERCGFCQKEKPSPSLLLCDRCRDPPATMDSSFCIKCGKFKHPADFKEVVLMFVFPVRACRCVSVVKMKGTRVGFPRFSGRKMERMLTALLVLEISSNALNVAIGGIEAQNKSYSNCCICHT
eukprot:TRINITY_DN4594_c0_g1_i1.p1 TRINITY_DN4594_c0_g1~~TRINITY_DN4594_c0_g1_i1.p1  ORF type:complete len:155 (-),score=11.40 TRINITY_DN4594_c0_g1_i1:61-525(-)